MHEDTTSAILRRLFDADRVIHEQLLGLEWEAPAVVAAIDPAKGACRLRLLCVLGRDG